MRCFRFLLLPIFLSLCAPSCSAKKLPVKTLSIERKSGGTVSLEAEIADTPEARQKGYMGRTEIPDGTGMLFVFEKDSVQFFWMKNTPHPLSIAFISSDGTIRDIHDMRPYSLSETQSATSVRYALEVPQGWFSKVGISEGDRLNLDGIGKN